MPEATVLDWCDAFVGSIGARGITLCDTTGMAYPGQVALLTRKFRERWPDTELTLHFHNTRGMGLANVLAAIDGGADDSMHRSAASAAAPTRRAPQVMCAPRTSCIAWNSWATTRGWTSAVSSMLPSACRHSSATTFLARLSKRAAASTCTGYRPTSKLSDNGHTADSPQALTRLVVSAKSLLWAVALPHHGIFQENVLVPILLAHVATRVG